MLSAALRLTAQVLVGLPRSLPHALPPPLCRCLPASAMRNGLREPGSQPCLRSQTAALAAFPAPEQRRPQHQVKRKAGPQSAGSQPAARGDFR